MDESLHKESLIDRLAASREEISARTRDLREDLSLVEKWKRGFRAHPVGWLGTAVAVGLLLSGVPFHRKKRRGLRESADANATAGFALPVVKLALQTLRPVVALWLKRRIGTDTRK